MRIALLHGWELTGSGSNEYNRYLAGALAKLGHEVHVLCREPHPEKLDVPYRIHVLPHSDVRPVFVTDKQRAGNVKAYADLSDAELDSHLESYVQAVQDILQAHPVDVVHANHVIPQPAVAHRAGAPYVVFPHGSAIEYTVRRDARYLALAEEGIAHAKHLIIGSNEVRNRLLVLYPHRRDEILERSSIIGVGVDTSLFEPVPRAERRASIDRLIAKAPGGGRTPAVTAEVLAERDVFALPRYKDRYVRELPDADAAKRLASVDWAGENILLFVGALTVGKGLQSVLVALPEILRRAPKTRMVIVGSGAYREVLEALVGAISRGDAPLLDALVQHGNDLEKTHLSGPWTDVAAYLEKHRADVLGAGASFSDRVLFVGRMGHDLLRHLFPCADVAVFPSVVPEAYPLVLMESLSNGVLPVASNFSGFAEGLDNLEEDLGREVVASMRLPMGDDVRVAEIAKRLGHLLSKRTDRSAQLRKIAVSRYDWSIRAQHLVDAYERHVIPK